MPEHKSGKKGRKHCRNQEFCKAYKLEGREELNKAIKQERHKKSHPSDTAKKGPVNYTQKRWRSALDHYLEKNIPKNLTKYS